jgi:hypothetical protein
MVARHRRVKELSEAQRRAFLDGATSLHKTIVDTLRTTWPTCPDHQALSALNGAICATIETITGAPPA